MDQLINAVQQAVIWYASDGWGANTRLFSIFDDERQIFTVTSVDYPSRNKSARVIVLVRIVGDQVIVEEDRTDKPVYERLMRYGVPREKIILAYRGEPVPDAPAEVPV